jgi:acetyltransferase-like isoleucine patch superfamily enzyme
MNNNIIDSKYIIDIRNRSKWRFLKGMYPRFRAYIKNSYIVWIARKNGANVGKCVTMPYKLAKHANSNLTIGHHTSIQSYKIDLRSPVKIGKHVIVGSDIEIITTSHNVDSVNWEHKYYGIEIEDYCWLATRSFVLPSCRKIGYGAVCAAGSVLARNEESMDIVTGNPAYTLRKRKCVHSDLCVESMLGNDFLAYRNAYIAKSK